MIESDVQVLVVDDERFFREAIAEVLGEQGFECELCETGEAAAALARERRYSVAVLDIRLPGIDGIEVLKRLREIQPSLRVIMLSASTDQELVLEALRLGACDYLAKPLHDEELTLAVRRACESYAVTSHWGRLRGRLDRLVVLMEETASRVQAATREERSAILQRETVAVAVEVLDARKVSMMLFNEEGNMLEVVAAQGHGLEPEQMDRVPVGRGVAGVALERLEPVIVTNAGSDSCPSLSTSL